MLLSWWALVLGVLGRSFKILVVKRFEKINELPCELFVVWSESWAKWATMWIVCSLNLGLNSAQRKIHFQRVVLFPLEFHLILTHRVLPVISGFWKIFICPYLKVSILGAHPFSGYGSGDHVFWIPPCIKP